LQLRLGRLQRPVWTILKKKIIGSTGTRIPTPPARSQSLYRMRYGGPVVKRVELLSGRIYVIPVAGLLRDTATLLIIVIIIIIIMHCFVAGSGNLKPVTGDGAALVSTKLHLPLMFVSCRR
jgi:hypothetical protein